MKEKFIGDGVQIYVKDGVHLQVMDKQIVFTDWEEFREFMYKYEELYTDAALTKKRQKYGKDLIINYDSEEEVWTVFWKGQSIEVWATLLRELDVIMRFFLRRYHKLMLDYGTYKLREGFTVETGSMRYMSAVNTGL